MKNIIKNIINYKGLILLVLVLFSSCNREKLYREEITGLFDTTHILVGYDKNKRGFQEKVKIYKEEMEKYHKLYTIYENFHGINNVKTINDNAGIKAVKVDTEIIELLEKGIEWKEETGNKVDIFGGEIISLWNNRKEDELPSKIDLENAKKCSIPENVEINKNQSTVF